jgi:GAF domain-containing protein
MSATPESTLTNPEQRIADLERQLAEREAELAERTAERDEALQRETAAAEVLSVINSSPGDLTPVFDALLDKALRLCEASYGTLLTWDGERLHRSSFRGASVELLQALGEPVIPPPGSVADRLLRGEDIIYTADVTQDPDFARSPRVQILGRVGGVRSYIAVPLRKDNRLLGFIAIYRREVGPFTEKQTALLQNFAAQAVIAMENARLITETRETLEQQTATAEVLGVINSSPGNLTPVFDAILEKAHSLCGGASGGLVVIEGDRARAVAVHGDPKFAEYWMQQGWFRPLNPETFARLQRGDPNHILDAASEEVRSHSTELANRLAELSGARTLLSVPLRNDHALLGVITAFRQEVRPFSDREIALLQNFAAQAVIAMENARLITETHDALEQQTATAEVLQVINSSPGDLTPVFDAMLDRAMRLCEADFGLMLTIDGAASRIVAERGVPEPLTDFLVQHPPEIGPDTFFGRAVLGRSVLHSADMRAEAAYSSGQPLTLTAVDLAGVRALLMAPLHKDDGVAGVFAIFRREARPFADKQIALLQNFAAQAVIAMENARLLTETREALEQQTATAEVLQVINSSPGDLTPVFDAIVEKAMRLCEAAHGHLWIYDGARVHPVAVRGDPRLVEWMNQRGVSPVLPASGPGAIGRILGGERYAHITDALADEAYRSLPHFREMVDHGGIRTLLDVPLRKDGSVLGIIAVYRQEIRPFSDKEIALLENFAAQAVIAMENARLLTETREALEQQTATAEVLQVINSSPGNLAPVFDAILEEAMRVCGASCGYFLRRQNGIYSFAAGRGLTAELAQYMTHMDQPGAEEGAGQILEGKPYVHIVDGLDDDAYRSGAPLRRAVVDLGGLRTGLNVPLRKDNNVLGALALGHREVRPFTERQIALVQNFAAQAVIAMENARLITETREALEQQTATAEVLGVINSSPGDLAPVFDAMLEKATRLCEAPFGILRTWDGEHFHLGAVHGDAPGYRDWAQQRGPIPIQPSRDNASPLGRILAGERVVHFADAPGGEGYITSSGFRDMLQASGVRSAIWVALRKDDALLGVIIVYRQEVRPFTDKQIALLENFAAQAVIAMENARLLGELRQRTDEVAELNRGLEVRVAEQVEELGRVGRLKRFLAPQLAELIVSHGDEKILESHRREIVVVFCDLRGYTAFTETAEPEEVLDFLREYHGTLGPLVSQFEGTLDQFSGDGIMVFFNDPVPIPDPAARAVKMAMAMREAAGTLIAEWRERGRDLGFGAGIAQGYATLGQIGFSERSGYTAIGTVCNVAARLCAEAKDGQILVSQRINVALRGSIATEQLGPIALKGLTQPVVAYNVPVAATQPALRVIEGGPQSV